MTDPRGTRPDAQPQHGHPLNTHLLNAQPLDGQPSQEQPLPERRPGWGDRFVGPESAARAATFAGS